jgi:hypothetical protein
MRTNRPVLVASTSSARCSCAIAPVVAFCLSIFLDKNTVCISKSQSTLRPALSAQSKPAPSPGRRWTLPLCLPEVAVVEATWGSRSLSFLDKNEDERNRNEGQYHSLLRFLSRNCKVSTAPGRHRRFTHRAARRARCAWGCAACRWRWWCGTLASSPTFHPPRPRWCSCAQKQSGTRRPFSMFDKSGCGGCLDIS